MASDHNASPAGGTGHPAHRGGYWLLAALLVAALATAAIVATYPHISQTWDEPAHVAAGLQRLETGAYTFEPQHPPVARMAVALLPYLDGLRGLGRATVFDEGIALLGDAPDAPRTLALARLGVLPFFLLLLAATGAWAWRLAGPGAATIAVFLLATLPPLLGNAGLATTDVPSTATLALAMLPALAWFERPDWRRALALGLAAGLAVTTKFSAIPFLGLLLVAWLAVRWAVGGAGRPALPWRLADHALVVAGLLLVLTVAYGPGFTWLLDPANAPFDGLDRLVGTEGALRDAAYAIVLSPVWPHFAPSVLRGIQQVAQHNAGGHASFLLGEVRAHGWWYFYPVALAVRTPLPLLALGLGGLGWMAVDGWRRRDWRLVVPAASFAVLLAFICGFSNINIGVRHAFVLYPLLAVAGGWAAWRLAALNGPTRIAVAVLLVAQATSAVRAHPDHMAYFNLLAGGQPARILINGDLDWGQDLGRLADAVRARGIQEIHVAYNGSADPAKVVPGLRILPPATPTTGWLAVSLLLSFDESCGSYRWLEDYEPVALVGSSIRLYHIEALKPQSLRRPRGPEPEQENSRCRALLGLPPLPS